MPNRSEAYEIGEPKASLVFKQENRARFTGEHRPPNKGDWYLTGTPLKAYQSQYDFAFPQPIATVHPGKLVWIWDD